MGNTESSESLKGEQKTFKSKALTVIFCLLGL